MNGVDTDHLEVVSQNPASLRQEFGIPDGHQLVVHVANFTPKKRHQDLIRAARIVVDQEPQTTFLLVGQGPTEKEVKAQALELGLEGKVVFAGFRPDAARIMAAADVFVLPSLYEGLPIAMLEAMALGRPVVASRVGGVPEVIDDEVDGLLVDPLDPAQLAEKVLTLLHNPELRGRLSRNAARKVRDQFSVERMVKSTEAIYSSVLAKKEIL